MTDKDTVTVSDTVINNDRFIHRYIKNNRDGNLKVKGRIKTQSHN